MSVTQDTANDTMVKYAPLWAKEITLTSLVTQTSKGNQLLANIAKSVSKDDKTTQDLITALKILATATDKAAEDDAASRTDSTKLIDSTRDLRSSMLDNASSIGRLASMDSKSIFGGLQQTFGGLARNLEMVNPQLAALAGVAATVVEVFNMIWSRGTEMADGIYDMYDAGIVFTGGIDQFADGMTDTGLNLQQFGKMLTKNGQVVATMGIARTVQLGKAFTNLTNGGITMGMNFEQAQETLMSYSEQQRISGRLSRMSNDELLSGAEKYGHQLNRLSQVTGQRREQIDAEIQQNRKKPSLQVLLSTLNEEARKSAGTGFDHLQVMGKEMGNTLQDLIVAYKTGDVAAMLATNPNMTQMLNQSGALTTFTELAKNAVAGNIDAMDANIISIGKMTQSYASTNSEFNMMGSFMQEQVQNAQLVATSSQALAQQNADTLKEMATPSDATKIRTAQQDINQSLQSINNLFTKLAAKILVPFLDATSYILEGIVKLGTVVGTILNPAFDLLGSAISSVTGLFGTLIDWMHPFLQTLGLTSDASQGSKDGAQMAISGVVGAAVVALTGGLMLKLVGSTLKAFSSSAGMLKSLFTGGGLADLGGGGGGREGGGGKGGGGGMALGKSLTAISKGLGNTAANLGAGIGKGVGGLIEGLGKSLAALAPVAPQMAIGAAGVGAAIAAIGAGIAGASWIMGKAMPTLAEGLDAFTKVDGEKLQSTGMGMIKIGAGLIAMGVGEVASVWGSLASGIASFFSEDPITKLSRFGELSEPLGKAADAMTRFAEVYPASIAAINNAVFDSAAMASLDKLNELFAGEGFFTSIGTWLAGDSDFITKLNNLGESTVNLPTFASRITGFADAYTYLVQAFNEPISTEALANLVGLTDLINQQAAANTPGLLGSIFGSTPDEPAAAAAPSAAVQAAGARVAATPVDQKHKDMMEILTKINDTMKSVATTEERQIRVMSDGFSRISGVVH